MYCRIAPLLALELLACATAVEQSPPTSLAKGGAGPTVTAADPAFGKQGGTISVRVLGSGFDIGSRAEWAIGGVVVDPSIVRTNTTSYVSSSELRANITVGAAAPTLLYDIVVTTAGNRRGIGTERFEITTATALPSLGGPGTAVGNGINDAGQVVGQSGARAFFWSPGSGINDLGAGTALDVSLAGDRIAGSTSVNTDGQAVWWSGSPGAWTQAALPTLCAPGSASGSAHAISPDGLIAAGVLRVTVSRNKIRARPVVWNLPASSCTQLAMPSGFDNLALVYDVNSMGVSVGMASSSTGADVAVVWNGAGSPSVLGPGYARGIDPSGTTVVGGSDNRPAYWTWNGSAWSAAGFLGPACGSGATSGWANDVNASGMIVGRDCTGKPWWWSLSGGVVVASGSLPGLGPQGNGRAEAVNNASPGLPGIAGTTNDRAVYWPVP